MGLTPDDIDTLREATAFDPEGQKLGEVSQVYLDDSTGDPTWVTIRTGLFGTQESFVPLREATSRGGELHVAVDKATVKDAPRLEADGHLTPDEEQDLYRYYGIDDGRRDQAPTMAGGGVEPEDRERPSDDDHVADDVRADRADADADVRDDRARADTADTDTDTDTDTDADDDRDRRAESRVGSDDTESDVTESDEPRSDQPSREGATEDADDLELSPGETKSRLRRYVVTERVTRTVEELPDDDNR